MKIPLKGSKNKHPERIGNDNQGEDGVDYISSDEDETAAENWEPLPVQSDMKDFFISAKRKKTDIISTLVNIYGS